MRRDVQAIVLILVGGAVLRITIGAPEQNQALLDALGSLL